MDKPLPQTLLDGSSSKEREIFERWHADHRKVRSIILASMSNDVQKQYDRAKMTEGSFVQEHGFKMLSLVEKLEDLKAGFDNDPYIDVILQSLPPSYDPFVVNYNMNGLEKSINELINMLVQYEATIKKSAPSILIREASTSKVKDKRVGCWKRKKGKAKAKTFVVAKDAKSAPIAPVRMGKGKRRIGTQQQSRANDICTHFREKGHWKRDCPNLSSNQGMFVVEVLQRSTKLSKDEVVLRLGGGNAVAAEAGYALETVAKLLNIAPSKKVAQTLYQIWHGKPASYKYLRMWDIPAYIKRLVGDKLDSGSSLCRFIGYPKETRGYYFYDPSEQKVFVSRNAVFLERGFPMDTRRDELLLKESSEAPQSNAGTSYAPTISTDNVPILRSESFEYIRSRRLHLDRGLRRAVMVEKLVQHTLVFGCWLRVLLTLSSICIGAIIGVHLGGWVLSGTPVAVVKGGICGSPVRNRFADSFEVEFGESRDVALGRSYTGTKRGLWLAL
ncbi:hypothetical protein Sango_1244400 [Sesamum angolense]|uniref:Retroviral polymerase SH3-like domain-containing protein n=1 Tax=Sesamum angolense TaxID=2727404 RepID=A0AAE1WQK7_9LAMI|nr:hypothetical protein Sango_1244400 [Sesamum angolense]